MKNVFLKIKTATVLLAFIVTGLQASVASARFSSDIYWSNDISYSQALRITSDLYKAVLFRTADHKGLHDWVRNITNYSGTEGLLNTAESIANSEEFYVNVYSKRSSREILNNIYAVLFNRRPDSSGVRTWLPMLREGRAGEVMRGIVASDEFRQRYL